MSGQIFISYRRDESSGFAGRIYDGLSGRFGPNQIFIDVDNVEPGVDFVEAIEASVASCDGRNLSVSEARPKNDDRGSGSFERRRR